MKISRSSLAVVLVFCVVGGLGAYRFLAFRPRHVVAVAEVRVPVRVKGDAAAPVRIVEYTDFQCPACSRASDALEGLMKKYSGKIFLEHRHFPLPQHSRSLRASVFAECAAGQGKFWPFYDVLFRSQKSWAEMVSVDSYFSELAVSMGLDGSLLSVCVNSPEANMTVRKDKEDGSALGVRSTPTFFINGKMVVGDQLLLAEVENILGLGKK